MALDPYGPCPCGSGKKFKWCCQPIHAQINKAFRQDEDGQHEAALRTLDEVIAQHPDNPEVHGRKAQLLYQMDRPDEAEAALQKALDLNPQYPFGNYLRGRFRHFEGEYPGALLLFRKAADLYDPDAREALGTVYASIFDCEMRLNRPVAARAALQIALRLDPSPEEYRKALEAVFGPESALPLAARREYKFKAAAATAPSEQRSAWTRALQTAATGKLTDARGGFERLTADRPDDAPAWYNLGLTRTWLGDNAAALDALDRYVALEPDEAEAASAWALGEVLRCGAGMEDVADYVEHSALFQVRSPDQLVRALQGLSAEQRFVRTPSPQEEPVLLGMILELVQALTAELQARQSPRLGAFVMIVGDLLRLWGLDQGAVMRAQQELRQRCGTALSEPEERREPARFNEILSEAGVFPVGVTDEAEVRRRVEEGMQRYFEDTWIHRPLRSLSGVPPVDAAGHGTLRKKLRGVVQFLQECAEASAQPYDFDRLHRKLGLVAPAAAAPAAGPDVSAMGAAELAALAPDSLPDEQLEQAYQASLRLDARDLAARFGKALVARPPRPERPDHFPVYAQLIQQGLAEGNTGAALEYVAAGEKADAEQNAGRRQNDYDLRRGQIQARRGEVDAARETFERLIGRVPAELRYRGSAAEAMLSARQAGLALRFAQEGLTQARQQNNRDSEEYFKELVSAAQKQGG
jgi:tetratricopeptide (TPR) repeat protein